MRWAIVLLGAGIGSLLASWSVGREDTTRGDAWRRHAMEPPFILFRSLAPGDDNGRMVIMSLSPQATRVVAPLSCTRLHYAGGRGVCVATESRENATAHVAYLFDRRLGPDTRIELPGIPIRVRVAPTGRVAAITTLTQDRDDDDRRVPNSIVVDLASGALVADLGDFTIDHEGALPIGDRIAVSGVAFERDGTRFFATLVTDSEPVLLAGSIAERRLTVLRRGVANEALSPDGRSLAVKKPVAEGGRWQLAIIDLTTWTERDLPQGPTSVDDQVEWLDDHHVMYHGLDGDSTSLWILPADGGSDPAVLLKHAYSGVVER